MNSTTTSTSTPLAASLLPAVTITIVSSALFTGSHGIVRYVGGAIHPFEVAFFSNLFSVFFYVPWLIRNGIGVMQTGQLPIHLIRGFVNAASITIWYMALWLTPLADATALSLATPLFVTLGAIIFLGETVGPRRWTALAIGAVGALIIIRPGFETINPGLMLVLVSGTFSAGTKLLAKHLSGYDSAMTCGAYVAIVQTPITFCLALFVWSWPSLEQLASLFAVGLLAALGHVTMVFALRNVDASFLEPFLFVRVVWAALIGYIAFSELPDFWTWIGAGIIIVATSYVARREYIAVSADRPVLVTSVVD